MLFKRKMKISFENSKQTLFWRLQSVCVFEDNFSIYSQAKRKDHSVLRLFSLLHRCLYQLNNVEQKHLQQNSIVLFYVVG